MRRPPEELLRAVEDRDGRAEGGEVRFRCPCPESHQNGDAHPSARYNHAKGVWCCDVCKASGGWKLLAEALGVHIPSQPANRPSRRRPQRVASYIYKDESGEPLRRKVRWEPGFGEREKSFSWEKPDGQGGWCKTEGDGNPRVLYRSELLPVAREQGTAVLGVEGEKDCDAAFKSGSVAFCNPEGGGEGKWRTEYSRQLEGLDVTVIADKDAVGRQHAAEVAASLFGVAASVRLIELPGERVNDLSDWATDREASGQTPEQVAEELRQLVAETEPLKEPPPDATGDDGLSDGDETPDAGGQSQTELLLALATDARVELFHDPDEHPFAAFPSKGHREVWPLDSRRFQDWLRHLYFKATGRAPGAQPLKTAIDTLAAEACFEGEEHPTPHRVGAHQGNFYLDLCDAEWSAVKIQPHAWNLVSESPVRFQRSRITRPLPPPVAGGSLELLRPLLNLQDDDSFILLCSFLVGAVWPEGPYTHLVLNGEQGSAKSTAAEMVGAVVDPSSVPLRTMPRNERDLMIAASHSRLLIFDNLSGIQPWCSDALCRLSTGGGFSARQLYANREEVAFSVMRPVVLNGIDEVVGRQDLVDRILSLTLLPILDRDRRRKADLWQQLEEIRPRVLGALLDAVSCALRRQASIRVDDLPRMADFAHRIVAAEPALPWPEGEFLRAYRQNRQEIVEASFELDEVAVAVRSLLADQDEFAGINAALLEALNRRTSASAKKSSTWPKSPRALSSSLKRIAPALRRVGIELETGRREPGSGNRLVHLTTADRFHQHDRHNRHNRHEPQKIGASECDGWRSPVTQVQADRHSEDPLPDSVCDGRDDCDGSAGARLATGEDQEALRL